MSPALWHYTCDHGMEKIGRVGWLVPSWQPVLGERLVWLTDLAQPHREGLGLTSLILPCDRTAHRYRVIDAPGAGVMPSMWWPNERASMPRDAVEELERAPGAMPAHWWVCRGTVPVVLDERSAS